MKSSYICMRLVVTNVELIVSEIASFCTCYISMRFHVYVRLPMRLLGVPYILFGLSPTTLGSNKVKDKEEGDSKIEKPKAQ